MIAVKFWRVELGSMIIPVLLFRLNALSYCSRFCVAGAIGTFNNYILRSQLSQSRTSELDSLLWSMRMGDLWDRAGTV